MLFPLSTDSANATVYIIRPGHYAWLQVTGSGKVFVARSKAELVQGGGVVLKAPGANANNLDGVAWEGELWFYTDTAGTTLTIFETEVTEYRRKSMNTSILDGAAPDAISGAE